MPLSPETRKSRTVNAPPPVGRSVVNRIDSVIVFEDEDVECEWTNAPDGTRFVSGYTIVPRWAPSDPGSL